MKKYIMKQWFKDILAIISISSFLIIGMLLISSKNQELNKKMTDMCVKNISQK